MFVPRMSFWFERRIGKQAVFHSSSSVTPVSASPCCPEKVRTPTSRSRGLHLTPVWCWNDVHCMVFPWCNCQRYLRGHNLVTFCFPFLHLWSAFPTFSIFLHLFTCLTCSASGAYPMGASWVHWKPSKPEFSYRQVELWDHALGDLQRRRQTSQHTGQFKGPKKPNMHWYIL